MVVEMKIHERSHRTTSEMKFWWIQETYIGNWVIWQKLMRWESAIDPSCVADAMKRQYQFCSSCFCFIVDGSSWEETGQGRNRIVKIDTKCRQEMEVS